MANRGLIALAIAAALLRAVPASAQIPTKFTNLQVLPQDIGRAALIGAMRDFATGLGVRCNYCHVGENAATLENFDFASDAKDAKKMARGMMRMMRELNERFLPQMPRPATVTVGCITCHRGLPVPRTLAEVLTATADRDGVDAALKQYGTLRAQSYGKGTYDFSDVTLTILAEHLAREKHNLDAAIAVVQFNADVNPNLWTTYSLLAQLYEQKDDKPSARRALEQAIKLDPSNESLKKRLQDLK